MRSAKTALTRPNGQRIGWEDGIEFEAQIAAVTRTFYGRESFCGVHLSNETIDHTGISGRLREIQFDFGFYTGFHGSSLGLGDRRIDLSQGHS